MDGPVGSRRVPLHDPGPPTVLVVRVLTAAVLGGLIGLIGLIGLERERKGRAAGLKTHILVAMGSALFVLATTAVALLLVNAIPKLAHQDGREAREDATGDAPASPTRAAAPADPGTEPAAPGRLPTDPR